jgi:LAO/AO transport system kinase
MSLADEVLKGDIRAAARLISLIADDAPEAAAETAILYKYPGRAFVTGVTGAPGVGKSTLTECLIAHFREQGKTIGVIAIDPTSALTGGAILGDRIRMQRHGTDKDVFIRSLATRGWAGGLAKAALASVRVMDALGKDLIFIETVGSGQVEIDIVKAADTTVLVLAPGAGDEIQAMKAGIIESADIAAVNKADKDGAERVKNDIEGMLALKAYKADEWRSPVVLTEALNEKGIDALGDEIVKHQKFLQKSGELLKRRRERAKLELLEAIEAEIKEVINSPASGELLDRLAEEMQSAKTTPQKAAREIMEKIKKGIK